MRKYVSFLSILVTSSTLAFNVQAADRLFLLNGDRLTGEVLDYSNATVEIKTLYGVYSIPLEHLEGVEIASTRVRAELEDMIAQPKLALNAPAPSVPELAPPKPEAMKATAAMDDDTFWGAEWSGAFNFGGDMKSGNSDKKSAVFDGEIKAKWDKHRGLAGFDFDWEKDEGEINVDKRSLFLEHDYFFLEKWFVGSNAKFEQDDIARLDLRSRASVGLGYQPIERDDLALKFVAGPGYLSEEFEDDSDNSELTWRWAMDYRQKFYDDAFRLFHNHDLNAPSDNIDFYLFQSESGIGLPIHRGVIASGQVDFDWNNNPAEGTKEDDTTYSVKIGYEW